MTQQARLQTGRRQRTKQYVVLACVVVLVLAGASALVYYGEEVNLFFTIGGWNRGVATRVTEQFIHHMQSGDRQAALKLIDPGSYQPYSEAGKAVGLEHVDAGGGRGKYRVSFDEMIPPGHVELKPVQMTSSDRGGFIVPARFADGTDGYFVVGRVQGEYRIVSIPTVAGRFRY